MDGRNPFRTTLEGFDSPANADETMVSTMVSKWWEVGFVHPQTESVP